MAIITYSSNQKLVQRCSKKQSKSNYHINETVHTFTLHSVCEEMERHFGSHLQQNRSLSNHHKCQKNNDENNAICQSQLSSRWLKSKIKLLDKPMRPFTQLKLLSVREKRRTTSEITCNKIEVLRTITNIRVTMTNIT